MGAEDAGNSFFAVERRPGKFAVMVVQETGRQADAFAGGHIGKRGFMVVTLFLAGVKLIGPTKASLISCFEPLATILFTVFFLGTVLLPVDYAG